ncbi:MAG: diphthine synthase [Candidatus Aenigmarchaeota archaeon]|nr:diphthine synthase [Candidatus Aenigmarchaeota archaeon]
MLWFISIGLSDERDMSLKALEAARKCDLLFAEFYTSKLNTTKGKLEELIGKPIRVLNREEVEEKYQNIILEKAKNKKVGFLVGGDCLVSTTHLALRLDALKQGIQTKIIHGSSIISSVAETGLHIQKFGPFITIPFPEKTGNELPLSTYDRIRENKSRGLHSLLLLDVISEKNKYMTPNESIEIMLRIEGEKKGNIFTKNTEIVVFARAGSEDPLIIYGKVKELLKKDFGNPPFVLIVPGKLHFTEKEYLEFFRVSK